MRVTNDGQRIVSTDYWRSPQGRQGLVYLSINAGAIRLLLPGGSASQGVLEAWPAVRAARLQIVNAPEVGVIHLLLDDGSDAPFTLLLDARQCDRVPTSRDLRRWLPLLAYGPAGNEGVALVGSTRVLIAAASRRPDLSPVPPEG